MSEAVEIGKHYRALLLVGEFGERVANETALFRLERICGRIRDLFRRFTRAGFGNAFTGGERSQPVDATAARKRHQPREGTSATFVEVCRFAPHLQEHFLEDVFRLLAVIQYTHQQPKQDGAITIVELREGHLIPGGNRL